MCDKIYKLCGRREMRIVKRGERECESEIERKKKKKDE